MNRKKSWLERMEQKYSKYAIHNLMFYIIALYVIGAVITFIPAPEHAANLYSQYLSLNVSAILHGQVWRLFTFLMQVPSTSPIFLVFVLYLYYMIGTSLENTWGAFRFNVYLFSGILLHIIAAFAIYFATGMSLELGITYLNLSLFFAFAMEFPNIQFYLFFLIPVKVKYLAILDGVLFIYTIFNGFFLTRSSVYHVYYMASACAALVSILNFIIYVILAKKIRRFTPREIHRKQKFKAQTRPEHVYPGGAKHRCCVCGRTELDDPGLEFRYCSKCNGDYEYCQDHLFTHEHKK